MKSAEADLIGRCKAGDRSAFQELVEKYQRRAYGIAFGMLRNRDDALDAAQEAFVKVFRNMKTFKGDSSFYSVGTLFLLQEKVVLEVVKGSQLL